MRFDDRAAFIEYMTAGQPARPANIGEIVAINQGRLPLTMDDPSAAPLEPAGFAERAAEGRAVIDTRSSAAFGAAHVPGAYNIHLSSPEFEQRVGWVVPAETPLLLVLEDDDAQSAAMRKLAFVGLDRRVDGYLRGGMAAWIGAGRTQATLPQISVHELQAQRDNGRDIQALDVREPSEWSAGHIDGARAMSYKLLSGRLDELGIGKDDRVAVMCAGGIRSSTACSILLRAGYRHVHNVTGGMSAWAAAALPMVDDEGRPVGVA